MKKPEKRKGKIIFIDAKNELRIERTNAWLEPKHIQKISEAYFRLTEEEGFSKVVSNTEVISNNGNLSLQLYVKQTSKNNVNSTRDLLQISRFSQKEINKSLDELSRQLKTIGIES